MVGRNTIWLKPDPQSAPLMTVKKKSKEKWQNIIVCLLYTQLNRSIEQGFYAVQNERSTPVRFPLYCDVCIVLCSRLIFRNQTLPEDFKDCFVWLFLAQRAIFFSYLAAVTITGDRAANIDLCLALTAFNSGGSFAYHTYCDTGPPFLRLYPILTSECRAVGGGAITTYFKRLRLDVAGTSGAWTHDLQDAKREDFH
jgi:hypothetical protein